MAAGPDPTSAAPSRAVRRPPQRSAARTAGSGPRSPRCARSASPRSASENDGPAVSTAAMIRPTSTKSSTPSPRVASAGEPIRSPDETAGGRGSNGTALRLTVIPIESQPVLGLLAVEVGVTQVDEHQVHVGAAGQHRHAVRRRVAGQQFGRERPGAVQRALLALTERVGLRDPQRHRLAGDDVLQRPALLAGEHRGVDLLGVLLLAEDHAAAAAADRLVNRRR